MRASTVVVLVVLVVGLGALVLGWTGVLSGGVSSGVVLGCLVLAFGCNVGDAVVRERKRRG